MQNEAQRGEQYARLSQLKDYRVSDDASTSSRSSAGPSSISASRGGPPSWAAIVRPSGVAGIRPATAPASRRRDTAARAANRARRASTGSPADEEVRVGTRPAPAGEVVIGKHVETERVSTPVQRRVEHVRIERRPVNEATGRAELREGEIRVPLMEEEVVVEKRPVVKEEIVVTREAGVETKQVETDVRRERIDISGDEELVEGETVTRRPRAGGGNRG